MTKMVQLSEEAYRRLRGIKRADESFSQTVIRLARATDRRIPLQGFRGMRTDADRDAHQRMLRDLKELERTKQAKRR